MTRFAPCAQCAKPIQIGRTSLPAGQATCRDCRRSKPPRKCIYCERPVQARDMCSTHYGRWQRAQGAYDRRTREIVCAGCGIKTKARPGSRYCTSACWQRSVRKNKVVLYTGPPYRPPVQHVRGSGLWTAGQCRICGEQFVSEYLDVTCSKQCQRVYRRTMRRIAKDRRRARERDAYVAPVNPRHVFEADGYRCHLCGRKCNRDAAVPHPAAATVDHIIPLAAGGTHEPSNCRTACFRCNSHKRHAGGGEQFALDLAVV